MPESAVTPDLRKSGGVRAVYRPCELHLSNMVIQPTHILNLVPPTYTYAMRCEDLRKRGPGVLDRWEQIHQVRQPEPGKSVSYS